MDSKPWKIKRKTGGIKRKLLKEYNKIKKTNIEKRKQQNIAAKNIVVTASTSQARTYYVDEGSAPITNYENINTTVHAYNLNEDYVEINYDDTCSDSCSSSINESEEIQSEFTKNIDLRIKIRQWALDRNICQAALRDLLKILNERLPEALPADPRTILQTPRNIVLKPIKGGDYWHKGLAESLKKELTTWPNVPEAISLNINFDGLPIFKSSKKEFWPILYNIHQKPEIEPGVIGIYFGSGKPKDLNEYLEDFVTEMDALLKEGIHIPGCDKSVTIKIRCFICDSPARAYIKGVCNFNGRHGCLKCVTVGEYSHQSHTVVFPDTRCPKRTDQEFRMKKYGLHHKTDSPLLRLSIDMIENFPISDSLHLIDLGVIKRLIIGWRDGNFGKNITKWRAECTQRVSDFLCACKLPSEIHRAVRGLDELSHWKACEFRSFFYYLSIVILPDALPQDAYEHFLTLFCAINICSSPKYSSLLPLAKELLLHFVENFKNFYGRDYITSNIHNLIHITDEVIKLGPLDTFNAYPFENKLYIIKRMLRNGNKPLAQVAKRLSENTENFKKVSKKEMNCPMFLKSKSNHIYLDFGTFKISHKSQDRYIMTHRGEIIEIVEITEEFINGNKIENLCDIFETPVKSSYFKMYKASALDEKRTKVVISPNNVNNKLVCTRHKNELYFMPLLHTLA